MKSRITFLYTLYITVYFEPATGPLQTFKKLRQSETMNEPTKYSHTLGSDSSSPILISRSLCFFLIFDTLICWLLLWFFISPVFSLSLNQEAGIAAYVSSNMSAREGGGRGRERASPREHRAFTEFRFCVSTADTAELTHKLMRAGGKFPIQPLRGWASFSLSLYYSPTHSFLLSSPQPNDGLWPSSPPAYTSIVGKLLNNIHRAIICYYSQAKPLAARN